MSDTTISYPEPTNEAEYRATVDQLMAEISRLNEHMAQDQIRIARLKIEKQTLRGETQRLRVETRAALARMGEPV